MRREPVSNPLAVMLVLGLSIGSLVSAACAGDTSGGTARPHVEHVTLPTHKTWRVTSVVPYEGLQEVELVKFDWPTADDQHAAFALSKEGLKVGDPICLDHVQEIDTFWAHPVPAGGCEALGKPAPATP